MPFMPSNAIEVARQSVMGQQNQSPVVPPIRRQAGGPISSVARQAMSAPMRSPSQDMSRVIAAENAVNQQGIRDAADSYVNSMQQRQGASNAMPQYLRFADTQNQREVNSGLGIQMDYGNLPSSQTQLDFANRAENRGQRGGQLLSTVMNPVSYNGIRVNNQAIASNLSMSEGDRGNLAQAGFEMSPEGVIRRSAPKQTGGSTLGFESISQTPASTIAARERYGMNPGGADAQIPRGRAALIAARTDLTPEQKQQFIDRANAMNISKGRLDYGNADAGAQAAYDAQQAMRQQRMQGAQARDARFDAIRQSQAQAVAQQQQAQTMGMIAQQAMMGNPQAMQILGNMQMSPADAARIALGQQQMMLEGNRAQQDFMLRGQEMNQRNQLATLAETNRAADLAMQREFQQNQTGFQNRMEEMQQIFRQDQAAHQRKMQEMEANAQNLRQQADAELNPIRKRMLESQASQAELNVKRDQLQFEQEAGLASLDTTTPEGKARAIENARQSLLESGNVSDPAMLNQMAQSIVADDELSKLAMKGDQIALSIKTMEPPSERALSGTPAERVDEFFDRFNQKFNMFPATYGRGWTTAGTSIDGKGNRINPGGKVLDTKYFLIGMEKEGLDDNALQQFISQPVNPSDRAQTAKHNLARHILGLPLVPQDQWIRRSLEKGTGRSSY